MLQAHRVFPVTAVSRAATGLDIRRVPTLGANGPEEGGSMEGACTNFYIKRLNEHAAVVSPELLQGKDKSLEGGYINRGGQSNSSLSRIGYYYGARKPPIIL